MSKIYQVGAIWQQFEYLAISSHSEILVIFRYSQKNKYYSEKNIKSWEKLFQSLQI